MKCFACGYEREIDWSNIHAFLSLLRNMDGVCIREVKPDYKNVSPIWGGLVMKTKEELIKYFNNECAGIIWKCDEYVKTLVNFPEQPIKSRMPKIQNSETVSLYSKELKDYEDTSIVTLPSGDSGVGIKIDGKWYKLEADQVEHFISILKSELNKIKR